MSPGPSISRSATKNNEERPTRRSPTGSAACFSEINRRSVDAERRSADYFWRVTAGLFWKAPQLFAITGAAAALIVFVLPAEYGIDPTGIGRALDLTAMRAPVKTLEFTEVVGGNETYREVEIPDFGEPVPLPNPAVHQDEPNAPASRTLQVTNPPERETEIKAVLRAGKMIMYSWQVDRGQVYTDFHGHDPEAGQEYWVRYKEQQEGAGNNGSLAAPFSGEHGWYWVNYNDFPVVITLTVSGYFDDIIDYGIFEQ